MMVAIYDDGMDNVKFVIDADSEIEARFYLSTTIQEAKPCIIPGLGKYITINGHIFFHTLSVDDFKIIPYSQALGEKFRVTST